eukprot:15054368-Alexandrium_andersonii.AAC.1
MDGRLELKGPHERAHRVARSAIARPSCRAGGPSRMRGPAKGGRSCFGPGGSMVTPMSMANLC